MKENQLNISQILKVQDKQLKDNFPKHDFEEKLVEFGYTPLDKKGFYEILQADGKHDQVSLPKLQRELQLITS